MAQLLLLLTGALVVGAIVFGIAVLITGGEGLGAVEPDGRSVPLPVARPLAENDLGTVRFDTALRGYRMAQVDHALRRIAYDIGYKSELIQVLEAEVAALREGRLEQADQLRDARRSALNQSTEQANPTEQADSTAGADSAAGMDSPAGADPAQPGEGSDPTSDHDAATLPEQTSDDDPTDRAGNADPATSGGSAGPAGSAEQSGSAGLAGSADLTDASESEDSEPSESDPADGVVTDLGTRAAGAR